MSASVFFTADAHFGHGGARGLYRRPFPSVRAMDEALVARWNATVAEGDEVWHLGDFAVRQRRARIEALLKALAGTKHLIIGNNDGPETAAADGWASARAYAELQLDGVSLVLCHYPFRTWNGIGRGALDLHGHSHGRLEPWPRQLDVGVDAWDFRPVTLAEIRERMRRRRPGRRR